MNDKSMCKPQGGFTVERCPSGLRCSPGKTVWVLSPPGVRISPAPPDINARCGIEPFDEGAHDASSKPKNEVKSHQSGTKLGHSALGFLTPQQVADTLGISKKTVIRWCESGKIPAIPREYGGRITYDIGLGTVELLKTQVQKTAKQRVAKLRRRYANHADYLADWLKAMATGGMSGKPYRPVTISDYKTLVIRYLDVYPEVSGRGLQAMLASAPVNQYGKRFNLYKAVVCFAKYLIQVCSLDESFLDEVASLYPRRHLPPKQQCLTEDELSKLYTACKTPLETVMVTLLANTGLRVSEAASLRREDIDLERQTLVVQQGKGGKRRTLGLSCGLAQTLGEYFASHPGVFALCDETGEPLSRMAIYNRLKRMGRSVGLKVSPHSLRRAFVTHNANKGRPLVILQRSCGHDDIRTTMSYCKTSEQEVIEAMQGWE
jgi:excisionase family DNA binding protein